jgi:hypothetical protein
MGRKDETAQFAEALNISLKIPSRLFGGHSALLLHDVVVAEKEYSNHRDG